MPTGDVGLREMITPVDISDKLDSLATDIETSMKDGDLTGIEERLVEWLAECYADFVKWHIDISVRGASGNLELLAACKAIGDDGNVTILKGDTSFEFDIGNTNSFLLEFIDTASWCVYKLWENSFMKEIEQDYKDALFVKSVENLNP